MQTKIWSICNATDARKAITVAVWLLGAGVLWLLWNTHPSNEMLDVLLGFALYVITFFYVPALIVILA